MDIFSNLVSYQDYLDIHPLHDLLNLDIDNYGSIEKKKIMNLYYSVDPNLSEAFPAELDDLIRLHYLIIERKVTTVLEFGVGKSSLIFDNALQFNKDKYFNYVSQNLRRANKFECFSVDNNQKWIDACKNLAETKLVNYHYSDCHINTFNGRICTFFDSLPNICPDLIYLDGPDQFSPKGNVRGINTSHTDRLPMAADILSIEHFLLPGTLIVIDGRSANARFLKSNFQRKWSYSYYENFDQHFFELLEEPLGIYNKKQIDFCLGEDFYIRLKNI
tara:strand:- start:2694 stop:3518 length:825 start_codon:yes stop_codon:yes gene_type:complete